MQTEDVVPPRPDPRLARRFMRLIPRRIATLGLRLESAVGSMGSGAQTTGSQGIGGTGTFYLHNVGAKFAQHHPSQWSRINGSDFDDFDPSEWAICFVGHRPEVSRLPAF